MSDLIERDKVIEYCLKLIDVERKQGSDVMNYGQERINQTDTIIAFVENLPSARPKEGKWIDMGDFEQCSACKGTHLKEVQTYYGKATWIKTDFCPNCGADMREREGE